MDDSKSGYRSKMDSLKRLFFFTKLTQQSEQDLLNGNLHFTCSQLQQWKEYAPLPRA